MRRSVLLVCLAAAAVPGLCTAAGGEVYRVGPGGEHAKISQVVGMLNPGDVVELAGDIEDSFTLTKHGFFDKPITIRGLTRIENGRMVRPRITLTRVGRMSAGIVCMGDWNVLEGLDITGATGDGRPSRALYYECTNLVLRNCYIHHNDRGMESWPTDRTGGDITIEFCEFEANGADARGSLYLYTLTPGAKATIQHCYFHDEMGGFYVKSRYPKHLIRYNWFENQFHSALKIINEHGGMGPNLAGGDMRPMHSDIVGNVFIQGMNPGPKYDILQLGGEEAASAGTEGDFHLAHNLFLTTRGDTPAVRIHGNVDRLVLYNNIFLEYGVPGGRLYERGAVFDSPATEAFKKRRGTGEPTIEGANNWVSGKMTGIPEELENTLRGLNPKFTSLVTFDFTPAKGSPLIGAGFWPLPMGRVDELAPKFEPRRGIPVDLKPRPRRAAEPPSIGPFEAAGR